MTTAKTIVSGVAGRYATALFELARDNKILDTVEADLATISQLIAESADFRSLIASPLISRDDQGKAALAVADKLGVTDTTRSFLGVVAANGRLNALAGMIDGYNRLLAHERGEVTAEVTSARKLTQAQLKSVTAMLAKHAGRDVKIEAKVDEALLGGLVVKLGSKMIDTSLKTKLEHLQLAMKEVG